MQNQQTRICFIVNPAANADRSLHHIDWLRQEASSLWKNFEIVIAEKHQSLDKLAKAKSKNFDVIVACGGDGTISQIINGLAQTDTILGVLPIGSGNDFVKSLGLNKTLPECLEIIYQNHITRIDLIRYKGDAEGWCANTIGMGIDGWANFYAHQTSWIKGQLKYYWGALRAIINFRGSQMKIQSAEFSGKDHFIMATICNGQWEGGSFFVAPDADMSDGMMDVLSIEKIPTFLLICYLLRFRWGPAPWMKGIKRFRTERIELKSSAPVAVHRDGEHLGTDIRHLKFLVQKKALRVLTPEIDY